MPELEKKIALMASRLRLAREQAGLSQGQVAKILRMHRPTISEIEAGRRSVSAEEMARFAEIYSVSLAWLIGSPQKEPSLDQDRIELAARGLAKLKGQDLDRVLDLLKSLRKAGGEK